ncbi:hypothetical protein J9303_10850 [Bacillaceae bacterium Marseille-Q3522]|nr:hypothetical protein [Bacillaceae bacterium Marseille-Q3522]
MKGGDHFAVSPFLWSFSGWNNCSKFHFIDLILPTINNPFFSELTLYIGKMCTRLGYKLILCNSLEQIKKEISYATMLIRHQVDGIIVCSHNRGIQIYEQPELPIVAIDRYLSPNVSVVGSDNYEGGVLAVKHLLNILSGYRSNVKEAIEHIEEGERIFRRAHANYADDWHGKAREAYEGIAGELKQAVIRSYTLGDELVLNSLKIK